MWKIANHPVFANKIFSYLYAFFWLMMGATFVLVTKPLLQISQESIAIDSFLSASLYAVSVFFLYYVVRYALFSGNNLTQQMINYLALLLAFLLCTVGLNMFLLQFILLPSELSSLGATIPARILFAILIYCLFIALYFLLIRNQKNENVLNDDVVVEPEVEADNIAIEPEKELLERIAVRLGQKIQVIPIEEIIYFQAEKDYVMIYTSNGKYLKEQTMKSLEEQLPDNKFVRVHRSNIINVDCILRIELYEKQSQVLILTNGHQIKTSQNGYKLLKSVLNL